MPALLGKGGFDDASFASGYSLNNEGRETATMGIASGDISHSGEVVSGGSVASTSDPRVHFGLGHATAINGLEVHWPSGLIEKIKVPGIDAIFNGRRRQRDGSPIK
jgi:hypothetical protein